MLLQINVFQRLVFQIQLNVKRSKVSNNQKMSASSYT